MGKSSKKKGAASHQGKSYDVGGVNNVSLTKAEKPTISDCLSSKNHIDDVGRMFCEHNRDYCHVCCVDHRLCNRQIEESAGIKKKETESENAARMYATALRALRGMERMVPRPSKEVFEQNRQFRDEFKEKLDRLAEAGEDVQPIMKRAIDKENNDELDVNAMMQSMSKLNPGQTKFEMGGEESQKIYDEFVKGPQGKESRADYYTCSYCEKAGTVKLQQCSRCKKASYCSRECQVAAWPAHKKNDCVKSKIEAKKLRLTWEQVEAYEGETARGTLEVKAIKDESMTRQVFQCKDRVGMCRRVVAYTNSRQITGLRTGTTIKWKNPKFHYFMDGSSGARIEEEDLKNITIV